MIPLFKSGNQESPVSYLPVSLTSISCKIFEHILSPNLANFLEPNSLFFCHHNKVSANDILAKRNLYHLLTNLKPFLIVVL